jgi:choline kinase
MSENKRKGLILAAGFGSRLKGGTNISDFKPLIIVKGRPLILRTIENLEKAGCYEIIIVLGYGYEVVKNKILRSYEGKTPLTFVYNPDFKLSNGVSILSAKKELNNEFIITMSDHILDEKMMKIAKNYTLEENSAALLVDYKVDKIFDIDDATKVLEKSGQIELIGKEINDFNCIDTGVFISSKALISALDKYYNIHGDVSISEGVQELANNKRMFTVDIGDSFWQDVDTPEMLEYVEKKLS